MKVIHSHSSHVTLALNTYKHVSFGSTSSVYIYLYFAAYSMNFEFDSCIIGAGTVALAKGLITTGGVIVAIPALAPVVLAAGIFLATSAKEEASASAAGHEENKEKFQAMVTQISGTLDSVLHLNDEGLAKLAGEFTYR